MEGEAHNPQAIRAPDGTFLLMDSYNGPDAGCATHVNYTTCKCMTSNCECAPKMPHNGANGGLGNFTFHFSKEAAGPWMPVTVKMECVGLDCA